MVSAYSFRPRPWSIALTVLACAAFIALGQWQTGRAAQKRSMGLQVEEALRSLPVEITGQPVEPKVLALHRVAASGHFVPARTVFLDNKLRGGRPGYEVVTPLAISDSRMHVLVNRGWIEAPPARALPKIAVPQGEQRIVGLALERLPHALQAGEERGAVRQNLDIDRFAAETGLALQPLVIEQRADNGDGLLRDWPRPDFGVEKHEMYALQWYSFAVLAAALLIGLSIRRVVPR